MKQKDIAPLPLAAQAPTPALPSAETGDGTKAASAHVPVPVESGGIVKSDLAAPSTELIRASSGAVMKMAMLEMLVDNVEKAEMVEKDDALDDREEASRLADEVRAKHRAKARALPWWRFPERLLPQGPGPDPEFSGGEPASIASLVIASELPWPDAWGKRLKGRFSGASGERKNAAIFDEDPVHEGGERLHRVAVVAQIVNQELRTPKVARSSTLAALRPMSRAECERRCGSDGFCDPSSLFGCGGVHCGRRHDIAD